MINMASSSGNSAGSPPVQACGSEEAGLMEQRKRKRMQSNRESARRSRMRKQQHLDDLMAQVAQLRKENEQMLRSVSVTRQQFMNVEAENSVLRAQMVELTHRLQSLNEILSYVDHSAVASGGCMVESEEFQFQGYGDAFFAGSMGMSHHLHHPIMAEIFDC